MKIKAIRLYRADMKLTEPYAIAYETIDRAVNIFIRADTDRGITGFGCCCPDLAITGETPEGAMKTLQEIVIPSLIGADPLRTAKILLSLKNRIGKEPSVLAGVDIMLYDILGRTAGLPLWRMLGGFRDRIKTSITIGILDADTTLKKALEYKKQGFKSIKIKGGLNVNEDIDKIKGLRDGLGREMELRFDANQGYSVQEAIHFVKETKKARIELIEQPTPKTEYDLLRQVTKSVSIPVMADESLVTLRDAFRLARRSLVDMINIKLVKVGGINEAMLINAVALSARLETMVGCMDESALSVAAGLHFALARPNVLYADLDSHLSLSGDPSEGAVTLRKGVLFAGSKPGIGCDLDF